jgi:hypothetical protein
VCPDGRYLAPYKNSPSAGAIPCAGGNGACGAGGCGNGCGEPLGGVAPVNGQPNAAPAVAPPPAAQPAGPPPGDSGSSADRGGQSLPGTFPGGAATGGDYPVPNNMPARLVPPGGPR